MDIYYLLLLVSLAWQGANGIMWSLAPNTQKCLKEELHANVLVSGEYEVTEIQGQRVDYTVSLTFNIMAGEIYSYWNGQLLEKNYTLFIMYLSKDTLNIVECSIYDNLKWIKWKIDCR